MNRKERAPGTGNPDEPIAHPERDPQTDEDIADVRAAREALDAILAGGGEREPGAL
jgi:hypothetical protein